MGERNRYQCVCGYETTLCVGAGRNAIRTDSIALLFGDDVFEQFCKDERKGIVETHMLTEELGVCKQCKELVTVSRFSYECKGAIRKQYEQKCRKCGEKVLIQESPSCPVCGKKMKQTTVGDWD